MENRGKNKNGAPPRRPYRIRFASHLKKVLGAGTFGLVGVVLVAFILFVTIVGPWLAPYSPSQFVGDVFEPISAQHWLGTDHLGRDVASRVLQGGRSVVLLSAGAVALAFGVGATLGVLARYKGGLIDEVIARGTELMMSVPPLLITMVIVATLGHSSTVLIVVVGLTFVPMIARTMRFVTSQIVVHDYVMAARIRGESTASTLRREIVPNLTGPALAEFSLRFSYAVIFISALSFLGLGVQPPSPDWGLMLSDGRLFLTKAPLLVLAPATAIGLLTIGLNLIAEHVASHLARDVRINVQI